MVSSIHRIKSPTEVDHYALRRVIDVYVQPLGEDLGRIRKSINGLLERTAMPTGVVVTLRGLVEGMEQSFMRFGIGLTLSVVLLYLILVAQFRSFLDPLLILTAVPPGLDRGTAHPLPYRHHPQRHVADGSHDLNRHDGVGQHSDCGIHPPPEGRRHDGPRGGGQGCRVRLRPVLMTSLATIIGLLPMALKLGAGSESYAPLARAVLGGMSVSLVMTVIMVPAAYLWPTAKWTGNLWKAI